MIFAGLGGGGGSSRQGPREPIMTKEAMMEDLVKRSADSSSGSQASAVNSGTGGAEPVWQEAGGGFDIDLGKKFTLRQYGTNFLLWLLSADILVQICREEGDQGELFKYRQK